MKKTMITVMFLCAASFQSFAMHEAIPVAHAVPHAESYNTSTNFEQIARVATAQDASAIQTKIKTPPSNKNPYNPKTGRSPKPSLKSLVIDKKQNAPAVIDFYTSIPANPAMIEAFNRNIVAAKPIAEEAIPTNESPAMPAEPQIIYNAHGQIAREHLINPDGSEQNTIYEPNGDKIVELLDSNKIKTQVSITKPDGSAVIKYYNARGIKTKQDTITAEGARVTTSNTTEGTIMDAAVYNKNNELEGSASLDDYGVLTNRSHTAEGVTSTFRQRTNNEYSSSPDATFTTTSIDPHDGSTITTIRDIRTRNLIETIIENVDQHGVKTIVTKDAENNIIETITESVDQHGMKTTIVKNGENNIIETITESVDQHGVKTTVVKDGENNITNETIIATDGTTIENFYAHDEPGKLSIQQTTQSNGNVFINHFTNGVKTSTEIHYEQGGSEITTFAKDGITPRKRETRDSNNDVVREITYSNDGKFIKSEFIQNPDGSTIENYYEDASNKLNFIKITTNNSTSRSYFKNGVKTDTKITRKDGSSETTYFAQDGVTPVRVKTFDNDDYLTRDITYSKDGKFIQRELFKNPDHSATLNSYKNGLPIKTIIREYDINYNLAKTITYSYGPTGKRTQQIVTEPDGRKVVTNYWFNGTDVKTTESFDPQGKRIETGSTFQQHPSLVPQKNNPPISNARLKNNGNIGLSKAFGSNAKSLTTKPLRQSSLQEID